MPHRVKNKHRARHRSQTVKAANLSRPALPLPAGQAATAPIAEASGASAVSVTETPEQAAGE